jgi:hypothetical protein
MRGGSDDITLQCQGLKLSDRNSNWLRNRDSFISPVTSTCYCASGYKLNTGSKN